MKWKTAVSLVGALTMLLGQTVNGIVAFAETSSGEGNKITEELYFSQDNNKISEVTLSEEATSVNLVSSNKEDKVIEVTLPNNTELNLDLTNKNLIDANSVVYNTDENKALVTFNDTTIKSKQTSLFLSGRSDSSDQNKVIVAKSSRGDGTVYQSLPLKVLFEDKIDKGETDAIQRAGTANVDLDIAPVTDSVLSGDDLVYALNFKVTGNQTTYYNAKVSVALPEGYELNQPLDELEINGVTPVFDANTGLLSYSFPELSAGQAYRINLKVGTKNGTTIDGEKVTLTADFTADNFEGDAKTEATETIKASSSLAASKSYLKTFDKNGKEKTTPPTAGDTGVWNIKVSAAQKKTGLLYFKEGTKIRVVDTLPAGMTYVSDDSNGKYDATSKTVTWEFDAPATKEQEEALDYLINKELNVTVRFDDDIKNYQKFKNNVHAEGTDVSDKEISSDASANVMAGLSGPANPEVPQGSPYLPWHIGPKKDGKISDTNLANPDETFYDGKVIQFQYGLVPWLANSRDKDFESYQIEYNIDDHLDLKNIYIPRFNYSPDATLNENITVYPEGTIYVVVDGVEKELTSFIAPEKSWKAIKLSEFGISEGTHIESYRIDFTKYPAGANNYSGILADFSIEKNYVGDLKNEVIYDVKGYDQNNKPVHWSNDSNNKPGKNPGEYNKISSTSGSRTAHVIASPDGDIPIGISKIRFDNHKNGIVNEGANRITGSFGVDASSTKNMSEPLSAMALLPVGVKIDMSKPDYQLKNSLYWDEATQDGNNESGKVTIISDNYNGTGRQLVKTEWNEPELSSGYTLSYGFNVIIDADAPTPLTMDTFGYSGDSELAVPSGSSVLTDSYLQTNKDDLDGSGKKDKPRVQSANQYRMIKASDIQTEKLVKGENDKEFSKFGHTNLGGKIEYQLNVMNKGSKIGNFVMMDVLPSVGDLGITDNTDRGSKFDPKLEGPISVPNDWKGKVTVVYSESKNPTRSDLDKNVNYPGSTGHLVDPNGAEKPNWKSESDVSDWGNIHSFLVTLNEGAWVKNEKFTLSFTMIAPKELDDELTNSKIDEKERAAWNSFAYSANNSQVVEPERVGVVVEDFGSVILSKTDKTTGDVLAGAEFALQDSEGKTLQEGLITNDKGQIEVNDLAPGDYQFVETKAPAGYELDDTPVTFTIKKGQQEAVQVKMTNQLLPGSVVLTKVDEKMGDVLAGAEFTLQDSEGKTLQEGLVTNDKGQIEVNDLAPGDYQFVETKAPAGYELDDTPVAFTIKKGQKEAVQVKMTNQLLPGSVVLTKVDEKTGDVLAGAEFALQDSEGKTLQEGLATNDKGQIEVNDLAPGDYQFVETKAPTGYELDDTPVTFTIKKGHKEAVQVKMTNQLLPPEVPPITPPLEPEIHKDVEGGQHLDLKNRNQKFDWHVTTSFGNDTKNWKQAAIVDPINPLLEILKVTILDQNGKDVTKNGVLEIKDNKISFTLNKKDGSYSYLSGQVYEMTITTKIKDEVTDKQLAPYMVEGKGIPNQADLHFGNKGNKIHSEIPKVTPPVKNYLPQTGENNTWSNVLAALGIILITGTGLYMISGKKRKH